MQASLTQLYIYIYIYNEDITAALYVWQNHSEGASTSLSTSSAPIRTKNRVVNKHANTQNDAS